MLSVVVPVNDWSVFGAMLGASLRRQRDRYEFIPLSNENHVYRSAAEALNAGARQAHGDYLFFVHQDLQFESSNWLGDAEAYLASLANLGAAGIAGARQAAGSRSRELVSNIWDSEPPQRHDHVSVEAPVEVETLDECGFFVPRSVFEQISFDEQVCDGWHLYAVEYCLAARRSGRNVYVVPLRAYHRSGGKTMKRFGMRTLESAYFTTLSRVLRKHGDAFTTVATTFGAWRADRSVFLQRYPPAVVWRHLIERVRRLRAGALV